MKVNQKFYQIFLIAILMMATYHVSPASAETKTATVNATSLNVRSEPSTSAKQIGSLKKGAAVKVFKTEKGWANIAFNGGRAWVSAEFLNISNVPSRNTQSQNGTSLSKKAKVTATSLYVRSGAGTQYKALGSLKNGTIVTVVKEEGKWSNITYGSLKGWVSNAYLLIQSGQAPAVQNPKPADPKPVNTGKSGTVTATYLNFRTSGNLNAPIIGSLKNGTTVRIISESGSWMSIQTSDGKKGWVSSQYISINSGSSPVVSSPKPKPPAAPPASVLKKVVVMADGVNIRQGPSTSYLIVGKVNQGDEFAYIQSKNDWVQLKLPNGNSAWVAGWLVAVQQTSSSPNQNPVPKPSIGGLKGKRIVIDPGHGGYDPGAVGKSSKTLEADLTLMSARLLATELSKAGAVVILTRSDSSYISLNKRVEISHYHFADAFVSLHYNSAADKSATGLLTFYYGQKDIKLADSVHTGLLQANTGLKGGNVRFGNFHVLRENKQPAVLVELGFLSNPSDEMTIKTNSFQSKAAAGITSGLAKYFQ
ncbi:SH3 domain-containing protein [Fictibacillus sp. UD]|uniref:SH3 domain-containing protein n=1 Tax=Fictibacillus sp. UD TaxID=3038777 RepID=UPI0037471A18